LRIEDCGLRIGRLSKGGRPFFLYTVDTVIFWPLLALTLQAATHSHPAPASQTSDFLLQTSHRPVALHGGIGSAHDGVSTTSPKAQALYDQGLAYLHSYVWLEAARSFNQALTLDPKLAMAHCELTIAYTELNAPAAARAALDRAKALAASAHDKRHVALRELQMEAEGVIPNVVSAPNAVPGFSRTNAAYRAALDEALKVFPQDEELLLARGQAASTDPAERGQGSVAESIPFYDRARALAPGHFAAHHYLAHAYENTSRIADALKEGEVYAKMAPQIPHARHMFGHDLRRVGRIEDAIAEFRAADALEAEYFKTEKIPVEFDWHYQHNLDLLATSYQYLGQMATAEQLFRRSFAIPSSLVVQEFDKREWPEFLLARGRAKEALDAATVMAGHRSKIVSAAGHVEIGRARLALGQFKDAADEGNAALHLMQGTEGAGIVENALKALQAEFFLRTGQKDKARPMLEDVARKVRSAPGPDAWTQALFTLDAMARAARDAGAWDLAAWAARQMIEHDANYAGAHLALALVAQHNGDAPTARAEAAAAAQGWSKADQDLAELKTIRAIR
jgi:tetratricopeptide (TPR) repeat protein